MWLLAVYCLRQSTLPNPFAWHGVALRFLYRPWIMVSVNTSKAAPLPMHRVKNCHPWPSDCRLRIFKCNKLLSLAFLLILVSQKPTELFGIKLEILKLPRFMIHFPTQSVTVQGLQAVMNYEFTLRAIVCIVFVILFVVVLLVIKQSGDVHPNPGPESLSSLSSDSVRSVCTS